MKKMPYYMMLIASSIQVELTPEERNAINQFLRGDINPED